MGAQATGHKLTTSLYTIPVAPRPDDTYDMSKRIHGVDLDAKLCGHSNSSRSNPLPRPSCSDAHSSTTGRASSPPTPPTILYPPLSLRIGSSCLRTPSMGARPSHPALSITLVAFFCQLAGRLHTHMSSQRLEERELCYLHSRSPPRTTRVPRRSICSTSSSPGCPPHAHSRVPVRPCLSINSGGMLQDQETQVSPIVSRPHI